MQTRRLLGMGILVVTLLGSAGCGARGGGAGAPATGTGASAPTAAPTAQVQSSDGGVVAAPASGQTDSSQAPGQTDPGAGTGGAGAGATGDAAGTEPAQTGSMTTYTDSAYNFSVAHPADFVVRPLEAAALGQLVPQPAAGFAFLSPTRAASDLGTMEAADLELRVLDAGGAATIEDWLAASGAAAEGGQTTPFQAAGASGVEVCSGTLIGPGCSYYFLSGATVYQLIPASLEGETMLKNFTPGAP